MRRFLLSVISLFCGWASPGYGQATLLSPPPTPCEPVNPNATPEARALLRTICAVSGKHLLSGQHNFPNHLSQHSDRTAAFTGRYPMVWGSDFGFTGGADKDSIEGREAMIEEAKRQHAAGSIITLMWHAVRPLEDEPVQPGEGWKGSVQAKLTDDQWAALTTPGTELNRRWLAQLDVVARHLKKLREARIPVLWRPYHENNGTWFWWGGRKGANGFQALYRMTFDRMVNYHRLDNLVWVWNANAPNGKNAGPYYDYYPGAQFVDILATDIYGEFLQSHHDDLVELAAGKPVALGEIGKPPSLEALRSQPRWAWFMGWSGIFDRDMGDAHKALFNDPRTLSRGDKLPDPQ
jgi:mannan endo-1,4-beta-mannosidase